MFLTNFRPVPLTEHVVFQGTVYMKVIWIGEGRWHTSYSSPLHWYPEKSEGIAQLSLSTSGCRSMAMWMWTVLLSG